MRLAHLGPAGTYAEAAALLYDPDAELVPVRTFTAAAEAVERGEADAAVCAIENALEGPVAETLAILVRDDLTLTINAEIVLAIRHALVGAPNLVLADIKVVYSHPQALAQCRRRLGELVPAAQPVAALSTAAAIESAMNEPGTLAVGNQRAAELYSAYCYADDIADLPNNQTRFIVLAAGEQAPTGDDKTSLVFTMAHDRPGSLVEVLQPFADRSINMTKIESRPTGRQLGTYYFFADVQGHEQEPAVAAAIAEARPHTQWLKVLGSYPRWTGNDA
jgi:prephenate dehydratase